MANHHRAVAARMARVLAPQAWCLDVGCGGGELPLALARLRRDCLVVGIDPSASAIARGRRRARGIAAVRLLRAGAERLPLPSAWAHGATAIGVIKHGVDARQALTEVRRVVRPGGWLWIYELDPAAAGVQERFSGLVTDSPAVAARILQRFVLPHSVAREQLREQRLAAGWTIDEDRAMPDLPLYAFHLRKPA